MTEVQRPLAGGSSSSAEAEWLAAVTRTLNRGRGPEQQWGPEEALEALRARTLDDLVLEPLYQPWPLPETGVPTGPMGLGPVGGWDVCALHEDPDLSFTTAAIADDLSGGATSLWLRVGPDAIDADDLADLVATLPSVPLSISAVEDQAAAADAILRVWRAAGRPHASGTLGIDPLGVAAVTGETPDPTGLARWVTRCASDWPQVRAVTIDTLGYDAAGAGDVGVLAYAVATGIDYLRALDAEGVRPGEAFSQLAFRVPAHVDVFATATRLRALRRLWARVAEVLDVPTAQGHATQHAVTSPRMLTRDDPSVNLVRGTLAVAGAALGGADSITCVPYDTAHGLPESFSRRLALTTQLIAAQEAGLGAVNDPLAGAGYAETLTAELAEAAWRCVQRIEASGGMARALASGQIADDIAAVAERRDRQLREGDRQIVGVTAFPAPVPETVRVRSRPAAPTRAGLRPRRDAAPYEATGGAS